MLNLYLPFIFFIINIHWQASALLNEGLISSSVAPAGTFTYQVAIIGRQNYSDELILICGGAIIGAHHVLTAAECFVTVEGFLRNFTFSIFSDYFNQDIRRGFEIRIKSMFFYPGGSSRKHNLAVAKLAQPFALEYYRHLKILDMPNELDIFWGRHGQVAGHGYFRYRAYFNARGQIQETGIGTDYRLRNGTVIITVNTNCVLDFDDIDFDYQFCALMYPTRADERVGVCMLDTGSPLVIGNTIVGVVGKPNSFCFENSMYANVASYKTFIDAVMEGELLHGTIIHKNREHHNFPFAALSISDSK